MRDERSMVSQFVKCAFCIQLVFSFQYGVDIVAKRQGQKVKQRDGMNVRYFIFLALAGISRARSR